MCYILKYVSWVVASARWTDVSPRVAVTQVSVFNYRLESNICSCFIENIWKFCIKSPNQFLMTFSGLVSLALPILAQSVLLLWLVSISDEGTLPEITLLPASPYFLKLI